MSKQKTAQQPYMVSVYNEPDMTGKLRFTFVPKGYRPPGEPLKPIPEYIVSVQGHGEESAFTWVNANTVEIGASHSLR